MSDQIIEYAVKLPLDSGSPLERSIVFSLLHYLTANGWELDRANDGGDYCIPLIAGSARGDGSRMVDTAMGIVFSVMESVVHFRKDKRGHHVVLIVGNEQDIVSDWSEHERDDFGSLMETFLNRIAA